MGLNEYISELQIISESLQKSNLNIKRDKKMKSKESNELEMQIKQDKILEQARLNLLNQSKIKSSNNNNNNNNNNDSNDDDFELLSPNKSDIQ